MKTNFLTTHRVGGDRKLVVGSVSQVRVYRFNDGAVNNFCRIYPFYQNDGSGIIIPHTPELIHRYFIWRRKHGPKLIRERFKYITDQLLNEIKICVPVIHNGKEEWIEAVGLDA